MNKNNPDILSQVADYYSAKIEAHGATPQGVDWNGEESQNLRFKQLANVICSNSRFSINDIGCGYGAFYAWLEGNYRNFRYAGLDVSGQMIKTARKHFDGRDNASFVCGNIPEASADYTVASGIFNVRQDCGDDEWLAYIEDTVDLLDRYSLQGFAFNCLTSYSDADKMRDYLYYADPCHFFDLCKRKYSRHVALLHDYGLYEFTILVRKNL